MSRVKLLIAYDGTLFSGWQIQNDTRSVQGEIEKALSALLDQPVRIHGAGRTDCGVHATGQVAHFDAGQPRVPADRLHLALQSYLPRDIKVLLAKETGQEFHSRFKAVKRVYRYRFITGEVFPHQRSYFGKFEALCKADFEPGRVAALLKSLEGEHDFRSFALKNSDTSTWVRNMHRIRVEETREGFDLVFEANGFLRKMIRMITGSVLMLYNEQDGPERIGEILALKDNSLSGPPAAAGGLYLERVDYA